MIPLSEINIIAEKFDVPPENIEKDYVISWILCSLAKSPIKDNFIFYGGTATKRMFFEKHRFSEDIDLISEKNYSLDEILEHLICLSEASKETNITLTIDNDKIVSKKIEKLFISITIVTMRLSVLRKRSKLTSV